MCLGALEPVVAVRRFVFRAVRPRGALRAVSPRSARPGHRRASPVEFGRLLKTALAERPRTFLVDEAQWLCGEAFGYFQSERLGRRRWVIDRTIPWLTGYPRLSPRYERHPRNYSA